jgi:hypothetical protein
MSEFETREADMAVTTDKAAPYAPASTMLEIIKRHRDRGLPLPVNKETLVRGGVAETIIPRVMQALQTLDLIDEAGQPTPTFEGIRKAPEAEYKSRMAEWLNAAYADALQFVDPATADETQVRDAFRNYNPTGQQARMVSLFIQLYAAAGIGPERPPQQARPRTRAATRSNASRSVSRSGSGSQSGSRSGAGSRSSSHIPARSDIPEPLTGLLARLPSERGWTQADRDKFLKTFGTVLDFCFPIVSADKLAEAEEEDA